MGKRMPSKATQLPSNEPPSKDHKPSLDVDYKPFLEVDHKPLLEVGQKPLLEVHRVVQIHSDLLEKALAQSAVEVQRTAQCCCKEPPMGPLAMGSMFSSPDGVEVI